MSDSDDTYAPDASNTALQGDDLSPEWREAYVSLTIDDPARVVSEAAIQREIRRRAESVTNTGDDASPNRPHIASADCWCNPVVAADYRVRKVPRRAG